MSITNERKDNTQPISGRAMLGARWLRSQAGRTQIVEYANIAMVYFLLNNAHDGMQRIP